MAEDFADLKAHGVGLASVKTGSVEECRRALAIARHAGMKFSIEFPDITGCGRCLPIMPGTEHWTHYRPDNFRGSTGAHAFAN
jgi:hypothetical protein